MRLENMILLSIACPSVGQSPGPVLCRLSR